MINNMNMRRISIVLQHTPSNVCCDNYLYTLLLCYTVYYYVYNDRHVRVTLLEYIYIFILVSRLATIFVFIFMTVQDVTLEDICFYLFKF